MTVQSDGSVVFDFAGHISAAGVDLIADSGFSFADRKIRWHRTTTTGAVVAEILGFESATMKNAQLTDTLNGTEPDVALMRNFNLVTPSRSGALFMTQSGLATSAGSALSVMFDSLAVNKTIMNAKSESHFLQVPSIQATRILAGTINSIGGISVGGTGGWTSSRLGLGSYRVTYNTAFSTVNIAPVLSCSNYPPFGIPAVKSVNFTTSQFEYFCFDLAGNLIDASVSFHCIGTI